MPELQKGESLNAFVGKYMGSKEARKSFPKAKQRAAVAYSEFRGKKKAAKSGSAKLDARKASEIRQRRQAGESLDSLSRSFEISKAMASKVGRGEAWKEGERK
jgi:hypothetical protein